MEILIVSQIQTDRKFFVRVNLSLSKNVVAPAPASAAAEQTAWDSFRGGEIYWKK